MTKAVIVGLSGAHGTGKSTILRGVRDSGGSVNESQLSRAAQVSLGWDSLQPAQSSADNMWLLQDAILTAMYDRDYSIHKAGEVVLVDRTPADVWGYTLLWAMRVGMNTIDFSRLLKYRAQCREFASRFYAMQISVPISDAIAFVPEASRADEQSRNFHERTVQNFIIGGGLPNVQMLSTDKQQRVKETLEILANINKL